jgi:drug/metabolite transporter (DMT)-like permease
MNENTRAFHRFHREGIFAALSAGVFFVLIGLLFVTRPALYDNLRTFFNPDSWTNHTIRNSTITLPVPRNPGDYVEIYNAAFEFAIAWGIFQILILVFRFVVNSSMRRKARTIQSLVFWLGASYLINTYLASTTTRETWFLFWAALIVLIGVALIVRAITLALFRGQ